MKKHHLLEFWDNILQFFYYEIRYYEIFADQWFYIFYVVPSPIILSQKALWEASRLGYVNIIVIKADY